MTITFKRRIAVEEIGNLRPERVLYEFDGPRIFTARDPKERLLLAYCYAEDTNRSSLFVVPFSSRQLTQLEEGTRTVRAALSESWIWSVEVERSSNGPITRECFEVDFEKIPGELLPKQGTMLWPHLQPLVSIRLSGEDAQPGNIKPIVIKKAVNAAVATVQSLGHYVSQKYNNAGASLGELFDLRASHVALASFEIGFRGSTRSEAAAESQPDAPLSGEGDDRQAGEEAAIEKVGELLGRGLDWASSPVDSDKRAVDAFENKEERMVVLQAIQRLTSSISATVSQVQVGGRLVSGRRSSEGSHEEASSDVVVLDRAAQIRVEVGLEGPAEHKKVEKETRLEGRLAVSDKDKYSFVLRDVRGPKTQWTCRYPKELHAEVMDAFYRDLRVQVIGIAKTNVFKVREVNATRKK